MQPDFDKIIALRADAELINFQWRYELGKQAEELDQFFRNTGRTFYFRGKKVTGVGEIVRLAVDVAQSDVSRCRSLYRIWEWDDIVELLHNGWTWSCFKLLIDHQASLGKMIYKVPESVKGYKQLQSWVRMQNRILHG